MAIGASSSLQQRTEKTQSIESDKCWSWSIQPLVTWFRILGVNLPESCSTSRQHWCSRTFNIVYGIFCFVANLLGQFEILYYMHVKRMEGKLQLAGEVPFNTETATWNLIIDFCNYAIHGVGSHIILLLVIRPRWSGVMEIFQQCHFAFSNQSFNRIRKISFLGIAYIVFLVSASTRLAYILLSKSYIIQPKYIYRWLECSPL